jgi:REP element-mobilizing transposase RayT
MARHARYDTPGAWHHVMNRGIAKRTLFENELDIRTFLARLALAVRAGAIEVHAYCILTTHFHLLLRSPAERLSAALQLIQNSYSRWFNRSRRRDGPLYRGRFRSKRVDSEEYRLNLVRYIDENAVQAGLAETPAAYPHSSAHHYAQPRGRIWLERSWVEGVVMRRRRAAVYVPADYSAVFGAPLAEGLRRLVERRIELQSLGIDPLDDLLGAAPFQVLEWMRRKAKLADGTEVGLPVCDGADVSAIVADERARRGDWKLGGRGPKSDAWRIAEVALLRDLCGATLAEAGERTGTTISGAASREARHRRALEEDAQYAALVSELAARSMERCHGLAAGSGVRRQARNS